MPKGHRSVRSQGYYRLSPVSTPSTLSSQYTPISSRQNIPNTYYNAPSFNTQNTMSQQQQNYNQSSLAPTYTNGGPVQLPNNLSQAYTHPRNQHQMQQPISIRASSGAWTSQDDQTLMAARSSGMNWAPIQQSYFPTKTPNACRKRHERLMERRSADDWDGLKLEGLAKTYMDMRKEIWGPLAAQAGEKWNVVEAKCMSQGLKNLQTAARSFVRRERMLDPTNTNNNTSSSTTNPNHHHHSNSISQTHSQQGSYTDFANGAHNDGDSGYADEHDDLEDQYNDADEASDRSTATYDHNNNQILGGQNHRQNPDYQNYSHRNDGSIGSNVSGDGSLRGLNGMGGMGGLNGLGGGVGAVNSMSAYGMRLPSMDMGIDAIINRGPGGQ
ncbi:related to DRPLA protein [Rhynchosporium agropyri]|uniref:Related to DRPLA protein n=1 Tax=Rhynchosporium agropyri TaxID=914238 RepID=A0A1E1L4Q1_9HELO|nr:related to DRPLA protein [Rhynchosporium agropyri]